ncbi:major royal jelly protein 1-like [Mya arenaria]|uniref:major royal jelly protein 1-like n=1 Tax=Mya arenaria TaxID=6604 RepID=UPI0022E0C79F|nr:major royal jelly protein 1-like [Mya arenaria]
MKQCILAPIILLSLALRQVWCHGDHGDAEPLFQWTTIDYNWKTKAEREQAIAKGRYIPLQNAINGIRVYDNKIFVTVPRFGDGIPSTLNTLVNARRRFLSSSTVLKPYPSWEMQQEGNCSAFQKVQNIEIDPKRGIMFVIDTGGKRYGCPAKLVIYDVNKDVEIHRHMFPDDVVSRGTNYLNDLVMDYVDGQVGYLYITNTRDYTIVVYDVLNDNSYSFSHPSMNPEPGKTDVKVLNNIIQVNNGVNGIAISSNFEYVYYSPIAGTGLYQIPTQVLRNSSSDFAAHVRKVGDKPSQGDGMIMSTKNSLYFSVLSKNAVAMWEIHKDVQKYGSEGAVMMDTLTYEANDPSMEWVDSLALDQSGYLWFTTSRLQLYFNNKLSNDTINFRIWRAFVHEPSYAYFDINGTSGSMHNHHHHNHDTDHDHHDHHGHDHYSYPGGAASTYISSILLLSTLLLNSYMCKYV